MGIRHGITEVINFHLGEAPRACRTSPTTGTCTPTRGRGVFRTVTFRLNAPGFDNRLPGATDIALRAVRGALEASFVRVVKLG